MTAGVGYRDDSTKDIATGSKPQGEYMVASGSHVNGGCCFDYGNAETSNDDTGNGHMDAIKGGNAQSGDLTTWYSGALPDLGGYAPMHQEGAIVLGTGGDNRTTTARHPSERSSRAS